MCHELVQSLLLSERAGDMRVTVVGMAHAPAARDGHILQLDLNGGAGRTFEGAERLTGARVLRCIAAAAVSSRTQAVWGMILIRAVALHR